MIAADDVRRIRDQLLDILAEDAHNAERVGARLDAVSRESGVGAHAALLVVLTGCSFEEREARGIWEEVLRHRAQLSGLLGREVGLRVALLDHFVAVNRRLTQPVLIDLSMVDAMAAGSAHDPLTGLLDDRGFRAAVHNELRRARRNGRPTSIALFDIDDFTVVDRVAGSVVAERVLRDLGLVLKNKIRDIDVAARPGSDEFAVVLPETGREGAVLVAERFRREAAGHFAGRGRVAGSSGISVSGGVATYPDDARAPDDLVRRAAQALYRAKSSGKNVVCAYESERRRFLRFDLEPGRFEVEILDRGLGAARARDLSRSGILFASPEPIEIGEHIELRMRDAVELDSGRALRVRGRVVRLEETLEAASDGAHDRYEIGVAFEIGAGEDDLDLLEFLERVQVERPGRTP